MQLQINGAGKSYLAKHLVNIGIAQNHTGFAIPIKHLAYRLYCSGGSLDGNRSLTYEEFAQDRKNESIFYNGFSARDFVCSYSDLIQQFYGPEVWAKTTYDSIEKGSTIVIDDWRRYTESDYLKNQEDVNILTLYLDREKDEISSIIVPSSGSSHYEDIIKPDDCDIHFVYKSDYSNFNELLQLITTHVNQFKTND